MAAVAALFAFASCGGDPVEETPAKLSAPTISIKNVTTNGFTVSWKAVTGAKSYGVVLNTEKPVTTSETSYEFTDLTPGTYKVKVKAIAGTTQSPFSKVESVNIEGATSADWFTVSLTALTESIELQGQSGTITANPWDALAFVMKGTGVEQMYYGLMTAEEIADMSNAELVELLTTEGEEASAATLSEVNGAEGYASYYIGLTGSTEWTLIAYVKSAEGTAVVKASATTAETQLSETTKAWIGNWTGKTSKTMELVVENNAANYVCGADKDMPFELAIDVFDGETLMIDGLSVWGETYPTLADVLTEDGVEFLAIWNSVAITDPSADQVLTWAAMSIIEGFPGQEQPDGTIATIPDGTITTVSGGYPAYMLIINEDGTVECQTYVGELQGGGTMTVYSYDVFWFTADGRFYPHAEELLDEDGNPVLDENGEPQADIKTVYRGGALLDMTKVAAAPSAQSKNVPAKKFVKSNLVANSIVCAM